MNNIKLPIEQIVVDPHNDRIKFLGVTPDLLAGLPGSWSTCGLAGKLIAYARPGQESDWVALGFREEARLCGFFVDGQDARLWAAYPDPSRQREEDALHHAMVVRAALDRARTYNFTLPVGYRCRVAKADEAADLASLMQACFSTYPTPLTSAHIARQIEEGASVWMTIRNRVGNLASVASAELDPQHRSAELTDCATRADQRGRGLMGFLLNQLVQRLRDDYRLYSLARAGEAGINCVLRKLGFVYTGRLTNNCRMPNGWESMNVWCQPR